MRALTGLGVRSRRNQREDLFLGCEFKKWTKMIGEEKNGPEAVRPSAPLLRRATASFRTEENRRERQYSVKKAIFSSSLTADHSDDHQQEGTSSAFNDRGGVLADYCDPV